MDGFGERVAESERGLLEAACSGDQRAFAELYSKHVRTVYWSVVRMLRSEMHAEDTTQEVFVLAWNKRGSIRIVDQSILPWLLTSAQNLAHNRQKKSRRESAHLSSQTSAELDVRAVDAESPVRIQVLGEAIDLAVGELSDMDQTLYYLCIEEGLSYAEAASALGTTHGGVRNRLSRVRRLLQISLAPQKEGIS